jgi:hypothetical protein
MIYHSQLTKHMTSEQLTRHTFIVPVVPNTINKNTPSWSSSFHPSLSLSTSIYSTGIVSERQLDILLGHHSRTHLDELQVTSNLLTPRGFEIGEMVE